MKKLVNKASNETVIRVINENLALLDTLPANKAIKITELISTSVCSRVYTVNKRLKTKYRTTIIDGVAYIYR